MPLQQEYQQLNLRPELFAPPQSLAFWARLRLFTLQVYGVVRKDFLSEYKTRAGITTLLMFVVVTVSIITFATAGERLSNGLSAALLWIILFFSAMTGLTKSFVNEEERGTILLLKLTSPPAAVFTGKLLYNILLTLLLYGLAVLMFFLFVPGVTIQSPVVFWTSFILNACATASATTIIAAIIAQAGSKGSLFPILVFPVLLPLLLSGIESTYQGLTGVAFAEARNNFQITASYIVVVVTVSHLLFDFVWLE